MGEGGRRWEKVGEAQGRAGKRTSPLLIGERFCRGLSRKAHAGSSIGMIASSGLDASGWIRSRWDTPRGVSSGRVPRLAKHCTSVGCVAASRTKSSRLTVCPGGLWLRGDAPPPPRAAAAAAVAAAAAASA